MMRASAYNRLGVLMGTSSRASCPRWLSLRGDSLPMITLIPSQGDFCAIASEDIGMSGHVGSGGHDRKLHQALPFRIGGGIGPESIIQKSEMANHNSRE